MSYEQAGESQPGQGTETKISSLGSLPPDVIQIAAAVNERLPVDIELEIARAAFRCANNAWIREATKTPQNMLRLEMLGANCDGATSDLDLALKHRKHT